MFKWTAFPFIRIALCLISGILLSGHWFLFWENWAWILPIGLFFLVLFVLLPFPPFIRGIFTMLLLTYLGGVVRLLTDHQSDPNHYSHDQEKIKAFSGRVISDETVRKRFVRYDLEVYQVLSDTLKEVVGKIHLYVRKDSLRPKVYQYGDVLRVAGSFFPIASPKNPDEFDYKAYLAKKRIYGHAFVDADKVEWLGSDPPNPLLSLAYGIRSAMKDQLDIFISNPRERALLSALMIGVKDDLDEEITDAYSAAGAMHVLAVSGLHVGIVFIMLSFLFKKWKDKKWGKTVFVVVSLSAIWLYSLVTGFTPSVMRAVTMFSVIIISGSLSRRANIYNTLGIAAVVIVLYDPNIIYAVGFQLSFVAVIGIVMLHPRLYRIFHFRNKVSDYIWSITCVSISAQVATFPLTMLYFHQFPTYFLVSNLVVIPAAVLMLTGGLIMSIFGALWPVLGTLIGFLLGWLIWAVNELMLALQYLPKPIFDWLYFDVPDTFLMYLVMLTFILGLIRYNFQYLLVCSMAIMTMLGWNYMRYWERMHQHRMVFYEIADIVAIDLIKGDQALLLLDKMMPEQAELVSFQVDPHRLSTGLSKSEETRKLIAECDCAFDQEAFTLMHWNGLDVLMLKKPIRPSKQISADVLYLVEPMNISLNDFDAGQVLLGTRFRKSDVYRLLKKNPEWEARIHYLTDDGYWQYDWNLKRLNSPIALNH